MAQIIKFDVLSQRVGITINNGERRTPPPSKLNIGSLGTFVVISGEVNVPIDVVHDTVYLNSSTSTQPNAMTASQMEAAIVALFPNSNSGSAGSGVDPSTIDTDSTHRFVTDTEKTNWNNKANATGSNDIVITDATKGYVGTDANGSGHEGRLVLYRDAATGEWTAEIVQVS